MSWKDKGYDVGFGKPPKSGQFTKGQSGNRNGRPKGTRNFNTDLEEILSDKVTVHENGKSKQVSSQLAALMRLREKALGGDARAVVQLLALAQQFSANKDATRSDRVLSATEGEILQRYVDVMQNQTKEDEPDAKDSADG